LGDAVDAVDAVVVVLTFVAAPVAVPEAVPDGAEVDGTAPDAHVAVVGTVTPAVAHSPAAYWIVAAQNGQSGDASFWKKKVVPSWSAGLQLWDMQQESWAIQPLELQMQAMSKVEQPVVLRELPTQAV
jgi:hypothetical protein